VAVTVSTRLLSIGEFAAATQLSPKALRIYDDQRLLIPARIDATTGYRYYRREQVSMGRLIRTLREMGLPLTSIGTVISSKEEGADAVLAELAQEIEHRYARERRAYHAALLLLRDAPPAAGPEVIERTRPESTVVVQPFLATRFDFMERFRAEARATRELIEHAGLTSEAAASCSLIDPLSDDEGRLEVLVPVRLSTRVPNGITVRMLPPTLGAVVVTSGRNAHATDVAAALDVLFDWFDRRGCRALDAPSLSIENENARLRTEVTWAFERIIT
jgi:DNA-binding transcriptional MerR regulator